MSYQHTEKKSKSAGRYLALAWFRCYDQEYAEFWLSDTPLTQEAIELKIIGISHTAQIHKITLIDLEDKEVK